MIALMESDFRSPEDGLVRVIPGRELESILYALEHCDEGGCDGIFVQGKDIVSWEFLKSAKGLDRYFFTDVSDSFKKVDLSPLSGAKVLSIGGVSKAIDFSIFEDLVALGCQWNSKNINLRHLENLKHVDLWGVGIALNAMPLDLADGVREARLVRYGHSTLDLAGSLNSLTELSLHMARSLTSLPKMRLLEKLEMSQVGRSFFDYETIPSTVKELWIEKCAPIESWSFIKTFSSGLNRLVLQDIRCVEPSSEVKELIRRIPNLDVPFNV